jgi:release factor glutamine methyltransferase
MCRFISNICADTQYKDLPRYEHELLLARTLQKSHTYILAHPEHRLSWRARLRYRYYIWKRRRGYSIASITGHKAFYGLDFIVNKHTLIPRPETELMVELAYAEIQDALVKGEKNIVLIDVGTGSGCIPIAIHKNVPAHSCTIFAIDISRRALAVAKKNAQKHTVNMICVHGNLLEPMHTFFDTRIPSSLIITANLPYLTQEQFDTEPSIQKEPRRALVANDGGLMLYKQLLEHIATLAVRYKTRITLYMEIDPSQAHTLHAYCAKKFPYSRLCVAHDLQKHPRIISLHV